jgi:RNA polymerase sigma factor (sigma-70 family)
VNRRDEDLLRAATPRVLAALARRSPDPEAARDALQEALLAATVQWPREGLPDDPTAWLVTVASRRLTDQVRADRARADRERRVAELTRPGPDGDLLAPAADERERGDDSVALLFLCCHPALPPHGQVALTLRAVAGLSTARIARAFLVPEPTMAQRISRAKARLRAVDARLSVPVTQDLPGRLRAVLHVLYLIFTEGHASTTGEDLLDVPMTEEAIRLARRLHAALPDDGEVAGLLALMLLTDARRAARIDDGDGRGRLVPLAEQDRSLWDRDRLREGIALVEAALPAGQVGPYQLQAAIAAVHAEAPAADATDWAQIEILYGMLERVAPGPVVTLNHAVAVAMVRGPAAGLAMLEPLLHDDRLRRHHRLHAVRGHLLDAAGDAAAARDAFAAAARLATSLPEQRYLLARAARPGE